MNTKSILKSKVFWANVLGIALIVAAHFGVEPVQFSPEIAAIILGIINILLRLVTRQGVHVR